MHLLQVLQGDRSPSFFLDLAGNSLNNPAQSVACGLGSWLLMTGAGVSLAMPINLPLVSARRTLQSLVGLLFPRRQEPSIAFSTMLAATDVPGATTPFKFP